MRALKHHILKLLCLIWVGSTSPAQASSGLLIQPPFGCVATSMMYFLKHAQIPELSTAVERLPGRSEEQKLNGLNELARKIQGAPKDLFMGLDLTKKEEFAEKVMELVGAPELSYHLVALQRDASEVLLGQMPARVHQLLKESLENGLPVMAGLRFQLVEGGTVGHTVLITAVSELKKTKGFEIEFLNPIHGQKDRLIVEEEIEKGFEAYIFDMESLKPRWSQSHLFVINQSQMVSSPFLKLRGPVHENFDLSEEVKGLAYFEEVLVARPAN